MNYFNPYFNPYKQNTNYSYENRQGGLISVQSEQEARAYPVAPSTSVTFKDESNPFIYTKTMGANSLDPPRFEKFRLVREDTSDLTPTTDNFKGYVKKDEFEALRADFEALKEKMNNEQ